MTVYRKMSKFFGKSATYGLLTKLAIQRSQALVTTPAAHAFAKSRGQVFHFSVIPVLINYLISSFHGTAELENIGNDLKATYVFTLANK